MATIDPRLLTRKHTDVRSVLYGGEVCGRVEVEKSLRPYGPYLINIYEERCKFIYQNSPIVSILPFEVFKYAVLVHEVSHLLGETFDIDGPIEGNAIYDYIENVLDDDRDEYNLMGTAPIFAKYVQMLLACHKWAIYINESLGQLQNDLEAFYYVVRYGVIKSGADPEWVSFLLPLILSSRRGDRRNTIVCAIAIFEYLRAKVLRGSGADIMSARGSPKQVPLIADEVRGVLNSPRLSSSGTYDMFKEMQQALVDVGTFQEKYAGVGGPPPDDLGKTDAFYQATCANYADVITRLRHVLLRRKVRTVRMCGQEGELAPRRLRMAYEDSLTGEEHSVYYRLKRLHPSLQVAVFADVSYSTRDFKDVYGAAKVCFLAALEAVTGVQTALVNFNSTHSIVQQFGEPLARARLYPYADGGTMLYSSLEEAEKFSWDAKERYGIIVTDSAIYDWERCVGKLDQIHQQLGIQFFLVLIYPEGVPVIPAKITEVPSVACTLRELPDLLLTLMGG